jgi:hypothetical protein
MDGLVEPAGAAFDLHAHDQAKIESTDVAHHYELVRTQVVMGVLGDAPAEPNEVRFDLGLTYATSGLLLGSSHQASEPGA